MVNSLNQAMKRSHPESGSIEQEPKRMRSSQRDHKTKAVFSKMSLRELNAELQKKYAQLESDPYLENIHDQCLKMYPWIVRKTCESYIKHNLQNPLKKCYEILGVAAASPTTLKSCKRVVKKTSFTDDQSLIDLHDFSSKVDIDLIVKKLSLGTNFHFPEHESQYTEMIRNKFPPEDQPLRLFTTNTNETDESSIFLNFLQIIILHKFNFSKSCIYSLGNKHTLIMGLISSHCMRGMRKDSEELEIFKLYLKFYQVNFPREFNEMINSLKDRFSAEEYIKLNFSIRFDETYLEHVQSSFISSQRIIFYRCLFYCLHYHITQELINDVILQFEKLYEKIELNQPDSIQLLVQDLCIFCAFLAFCPKNYHKHFSIAADLLRRIFDISQIQSEDFQYQLLKYLERMSLILFL